MKKLRLELEPIPMATWGVSLTNKLDSKEWAKITKKVREDTNYECEICGNVSLPLHIHEKWVFDDRARVQSLRV